MELQAVSDLIGRYTFLEGGEALCQELGYRAMQLLSLNLNFLSGEPESRLQVLPARPF